MWALEMSSDGGVTRRDRRDYDDFDEYEDDELGPDEESEFDLRYMDEDDEDEEVGAGAIEGEDGGGEDEERYGGVLSDEV